MKKMIILSALSIFSAGFSAQAKDTKKAAAATTAAKLPATGTMNWTGYGVGKSHSGAITVKSGEVEVKGDELIGGQFVLDMATLKTGDSEKLQGHLQSPDFFDIKKYPTATFKITKVTPIKDAKAGSPTHTIVGDLTIKEKTHSETLQATIKKEGAQWDAKAETEIKDRTQYDIIYNSAKFKTASALGDKLIEDKIKVELNLIAK